MRFQVFSSIFASSLILSEEARCTDAIRKADLLSLFTYLVAFSRS